MQNELNQLTRDVKKLVNLSKPAIMKRKKQKKTVKKKSNRYPAGGREMFANAAGIASTVLSHPAVSRGDPLAVAVAAQLSPFNVPKGVAKKMTDSLHSQAITARGTNTVVVPANTTLLMFVQPCVSSDVNNGSVVIISVPNTSLTSTTSTICSTTVGSNAAGCSQFNISTQTPYSAQTLDGGDYTWRLVGAGLRVRNVSEQLYRGGIFRYVIDAQGHITPGIDVTTTTFGAIVDMINAAQHNVRKHFSDNSIVEILVPCTNDAWSSMKGATYDPVFCGADYGMGGGLPEGSYAGDYCGRIGGTTSARIGGYKPLVLACFANQSAGSQTLDFEIVEHWEVHGKDITSLHTPSPNHLQSQSLIQNVVEHLATNHSQNPHFHFKDVLKQAVKLAHNKQAVRDASTVASVVLAL